MHHPLSGSNYFDPFLGGKKTIIEDQGYILFSDAPLPFLILMDFSGPHSDLVVNMLAAAKH